jgi:hypothetical protein
MRLFGEHKRTNRSFRRHTESRFDFFDRNARPSVDRVRRVLEEWFRLYPDADQNDLKSRFRSDFDAAAFELLMHHVLLQAGYAVKVEPHTGKSACRPDFHATRPRTSLYMEATVATDQSDEDRSREALENALYEAIDGISLPDYFLSINTLQMGTGQAVPRRVKAFINRIVGQTDWAAVSKKLQSTGLQQLARHTFRDDDFLLELELIPKSERARSRLGLRPIGIYPIRSKMGGSTPAIRKCLDKKSLKYGVLDSPYVIAVNSLGEWGTEPFEVLHALFGQEEVGQFPGTELQLVRVGDGFFSPTSRSVNKRVSAAIVGTAWPWAPAASTLTIYHNPWAATPLPRDAIPFPQVMLAESQLVRIPGPALHTVLGLAQDWPGSDADENSTDI